MQQQRRPPAPAVCVCTQCVYAGEGVVFLSQLIGGATPAESGDLRRTDNLILPTEPFGVEDPVPE